VKDGAPVKIAGEEKPASGEGKQEGETKSEGKSPDPKGGSK
jgi:hypothetical protein